MVIKRHYTRSKIKLLDKKEACACYSRLLHVMTTYDLYLVLKVV